MANRTPIVAFYETGPSNPDYGQAIRAALAQLADGSAPVVVPVSVENPYQLNLLGSPDWLIVHLERDDTRSDVIGWRDVINAAPFTTSVIVLASGPINGLLPSNVVTFDMTGWSGNAADPRIDVVAKRIMNAVSTRRHDEIEQDAVRHGALQYVGDGTTMLNPALMMRIDELGLSKWAERILHIDNMIYVGDLVQLTEAELLRLPELGRKRLGEIKNALSAIGLSLGAVIPGWPPENMQAAAQWAKPEDILRRTRQVPSGEMFEPSEDRLVIDPAAGGSSDVEAGSSPLSMQLQESVRRKLEALAPIAARLDNQPGWHELGAVCFDLASYMDRPGSDIPAVLGSLYGATLALGSFVEMDEAAGRDPRSDVTPLDPSVRRPLQDVLSGLAPWLRLFPTIRELDDEAGMFLAAHAIPAGARDAVAAAIDVELIGSADATRLRTLLNAGERGGFISNKARRRGLLSVRNLVVATAAIFANMMLDAAVSDYATRSTLAKRAGTMLAQAEDAITEIVASLPSDVATAMRQLTAQAKATELKPTGHHQQNEGPPGTVDQSTN